MVALHKIKEDSKRIAALGLVEPPPIEIDGPGFKGSLALLFQCVRDRKVDLLGVPLNPICVAYLDYILANEEADIDSAATALMALSFLIERKSWMLLPSNEPEPEEDDLLELSDPTVHEFALVIDTLREYQEERERFYFRPQDAGPDPYEVPAVLGEITSSDLARALERLLRKAVPEPITPLQKDRKSLADQMLIILNRLTNEYCQIEQLISVPHTREDAVYTFLALLELIRLGQVSVKLSQDDVLFALATQ